MNLNYLITSLDVIDDDYLIVGVSSGPDSMALIDLLRKNTDKFIVCAHINHNVRKNSKKEEKYLKEYCQKNNLIFECLKIESYEQNNFEEEARNKRYDFYKKILNKYHSHSLFLAHHGDDLIETVLMKIIRGSNLEGYAGIKTYSQVDNYTIIRPLLSITKKDILKYNKENKIKYFLDRSNNNTKYTRNRLRKKILPILKKEDKNVHQKFLKYSNTIQEYFNYIEDLSLNKIKTLYQENKINLLILNKEPLFMQKNIIFNILSNIYNNKTNIIKEKHLDDIIKLASSNKPNAIINLPQNYIVTKSYNYIYIEKIKNLSEKQNYKIKLEDKVKINNFIIKKITNTEKDDNSICRLNSQNIKLPLYIRNKRNGDYIQVLGLNGKKKISDIFIENKISKSIREEYPILVDSEDNILWIPNIKKSKYNVKKNELCDIILTSYQKGEN